MYADTQIKKACGVRWLEISGDLLVFNVTRIVAVISSYKLHGVQLWLVEYKFNMIWKKFTYLRRLTTSEKAPKEELWQTMRN